MFQIAWLMKVSVGDVLCKGRTKRLKVQLNPPLNQNLISYDFFYINTQEYEYMLC